MGNDYRASHNINTTLIMITTKTQKVALARESVPICNKRKRYGAGKAETRFRTSRVCA